MIKITVKKSRSGWTQKGSVRRFLLFPLSHFDKLFALQTTIKRRYSATKPERWFLDFLSGLVPELGQNILHSARDFAISLIQLNAILYDCGTLYFNRPIAVGDKRYHAPERPMPFAYVFSLKANYNETSARAEHLPDLH